MHTAMLVFSYQDGSTTDALIQMVEMVVLQLSRSMRRKRTQMQSETHVRLEAALETSKDGGSLRHPCCIGKSS
jgi:hypothetical protein